MGGYLGWNKTEAHLLQCFCWPGLYKEVRLYCKMFPVWQVSITEKPLVVPLVPLPLTDKPFE